MEGQTAVVTAAGAGIGQATALRLAQEGVARLILLDLEEEGLKETARRVTEHGTTTEIIPVDCTDAHRLVPILDRVAKVETPQILINGVGGGARGGSTEFLRSSPQTWHRVTGLTQFTAMTCAHRLAPGMCERGYGRIVNISSDVANHPTVGMVDYGSAKSAVVGFTRGLALELARDGVTVNAVCPGAINTAAVASLPEAVIGPIKASIPSGRIGEPEDVAALIAFLAGSDAGYITGQAIGINGGRTMR